MGVQVRPRGHPTAKDKPAGVAGRVRAWIAERDPDQLALGLPLAIAGVYLVRLAQTFQARLTVAGGDSDAISPLFIAATMDDVPDAPIQTGSWGHYMVFWYARATEWLPFYRELWGVIPPALWIGSLGIVVWAAWRTVGKRAAVLTGVLGLCVSPALLYLFFSSSHHTWTLYSSGIAVGVLVYLSTQPRMDARSWIVAVAGAVVLGAALASDRLVLGAIVPLLLAGAGVAITHRTREGRMVGFVTGGVVAGAIAIAMALTEIMKASGYVTARRSESLIGPDRLFSNGDRYLDAALQMFNGPVFALGAAIAGVAPFVALYGRLRRRQTAGTPVELGRSAYVFFWAGTMALVPLAAVGSAQDASGGMRYLLPLLFAAAAAVPLLARSVTGRYLVIAAVAIYAVVGVLNIDIRGQWGPGSDRNDDLQASADRIAIEANHLISIADKENAHVGYAGYWEAASASWSTKLEVQVFPIERRCGQPGGVPCPNPFFVHGGWYEPRPGIRTFLLGPRPEDDDTFEPPRGLGPPLAMHRLLNGAPLYVYPYDIAARF